MIHPLVRDYIAFIENEYRGTVYRRIGLIAGFVLLMCLAVAALVVLAHEQSEGRRYGNPSSLTIVAAVTALGFYLRREKYQKKLALAKQAVPVWVRLVQANSLLFRKGDANQTLPCLVEYSFDIHGASPAMAEIAQRIFSLKGEKQSDPDLAYVLSLTADERAVHHRRRQLPASFVGSATFIYSRRN